MGIENEDAPKSSLSPSISKLLHGKGEVSGVFIVEGRGPLSRLSLFDGVPCVHHRRALEIQDGISVDGRLWAFGGGGGN